MEPWSPERRWRTFVFVGMAAAAFGVGFGFFLWHRAPDANDPFARLRDGETLREALRRCPAGLRAIIQDENGLHSILSDQPDVPASMPIWVELSDESQRRAMVTFSGQRVMLGGERVEVLADPSGRVLLIGDRFFWSPDAQTGAANNLGFRVQTPIGKL